MCVHGSALTNTKLCRASSQPFTVDVWPCGPCSGIKSLNICHTELDLYITIGSSYSIIFCITIILSFAHNNNNCMLT